MEIVPSQTLYINNINEKLSTEVLKRMLNMVFSQYGKVLDIIANKGLKKRGQAWVIFQDISSATNALRGKQGFNFYGKPLRIQYAKEKSDIVAQKDGTYVPREQRKRSREEDKDAMRAAESTFAPTEMSEDNLPNRILFCKNLPPDCTDQMLSMLFSQCNGFQEVRLPPGNKGIAFVDFGDEVQAGMAMRQLNGFQLTSTNALQIAYSSS